MPGGRRVPEAAFAPAAPAWPVCAMLHWRLTVLRPPPHAPRAHPHRAKVPPRQLPVLLLKVMQQQNVVSLEHGRLVQTAPRTIPSAWVNGVLEMSLALARGGVTEPV